jgi:hypothetical protein
MLLLLLLSAAILGYIAKVSMKLKRVNWEGGLTAKDFLRLEDMSGMPRKPSPPGK